MFGAITCNKTRATGAVVKEIVIQKSPLTGQSQNVFVHELYQDYVNRESDKEDSDKGFTCESVGGESLADASNKDIALIRLTRPFSDEDLDFETTNINTICVEHSTKVQYSNKPPLTAYGAGFGLKNDHLNDDTETDARQPYLSFLRLTVFQYGATTGTELDGRKFYFSYNTEDDTEQQFTMSLDDYQQRDTLGVSVDHSLTTFPFDLICR